MDSEQSDGSQLTDTGTPSGYVPVRREHRLYFQEWPPVHLRERLTEDGWVCITTARFADSLGTWFVFGPQNDLQWGI